MKRWKTLAAAAALMPLLAANGLAARESGLRGSLEARYAQMKRAIRTHDARAVMAILAPGFVSVELNGKTESADALARDIDKVPSDPNRSSKTTLLSVRPTKGAVIVEQRYTMKTRKTGRNGAEHHVQLVAESTDTWIRSHGEWRMQRTVTEKLDYYVDGKRVLHETRPAAGAH